jgi:hypothetical protein
MRASTSKRFRRVLSRRRFGSTTGGRNTAFEAHGVVQARDPRVPTRSEDAT